MKKLSRDEAYKLSSSKSHRNYYNNWADTYDSEFASKSNYIYPREVAKEFLVRSKDTNIFVADVGCGTGLVGEGFRDTQIILHGFDISEGMLNEAGKKNTYSELICLDLKVIEDFPAQKYQGLISSGTFTFGHLGPDVLLNSLLLCDIGALCILGINSQYFVDKGFQETFNYLKRDKFIEDLEFLTVPIYSAAENQSAAVNQALLGIFKLKKRPLIPH